jgi:type IV pilus modification protein PilV
LDLVTSAHARDHGFSLIEVLVAALVLCIGMAGVLPLVFGSVRATRAARDTSMATWLAWQKAEELRVPVDLAASPANTLAADTAGYVDYLDQSGRPSKTPSPYTRRWLIEAAGPAGTLRLVVSVHHAASSGTPVTVATVRRGGGA